MMEMMTNDTPGASPLVDQPIASPVPNQPSAPFHRLEGRALWRGLCSECGVGKIFAGRWKMNDRCPHCGTKFERGPGYFTGAMYFSYAMGIPIIAAIMLLCKYWLLPTWPLYWILVVAWLAFLPLTPLIWRTSRILFIHFDRYFDPEE